MSRKCDWDGGYSKDQNDNLYFQCIHCNKTRRLEELGKVLCNDKDVICQKITE